MDLNFIKMSIGMLNDEKLKIIKHMKDGDTVKLIWYELLLLTGKLNKGGYLMVTDVIPMDKDHISAFLEYPVSMVAYALTIFQTYNMIQVEDDGKIYITNWGKYQSLDKIEMYNEKGKIRAQKFRDKKKLQLVENNVTRNVTRNVTVTQNNAIDIDIDIEKDIERDAKKRSLSTNLDSCYDYRNLSYNFTASQLNDVQKKERADLMFAEMKASDMRMELFEKDYSLTRLQVAEHLAKFIRTSFKTDDIHHSITKMWFYFDNYIKKQTNG